MLSCAAQQEGNRIWLARGAFCCLLGARTPDCERARLPCKFHARLLFHFSSCCTKTGTHVAVLILIT